MKRVHPNLGRAAVGAVIVSALSVCAGGCRSTSGGNALLAPDRVPPPSTRPLLPGQAQPYYQGDPLPAMQSATSGPANTQVPEQTAATTRSSSGRTLAWNAPSPATSPAPSAPAPAAASPPQPRSIAASNEAPVAVPADADPLRFALPEPADPQPTAPIIVAASPKPQPAPIPSARPSQDVLLASYNAPVPSRPATPANLSTMNAAQQVSSPWRSPQISTGATSSLFAAQPTNMQPLAPPSNPLPPPPMIAAIQQQVMVPTNSMGVTLRAVPSPPPQPGDPTPRIRMPGYLEPPALSSPDGFRPRTSMQ